MAWIKLETTYLDHPGFTQVSQRFRIPPVAVRGLMVGLLSWAIKFAPDGDLSRYDLEDLEVASGYYIDGFKASFSDFVDELVRVGLLLRTPVGLSIPDCPEVEAGESK